MGTWNTCTSRTFGRLEKFSEDDVHTIDGMRAWLKPLGYSNTINEAAINFILREFIINKVSVDSMMNIDMDMVVDLTSSIRLLTS